jgi:hypothetical protein
MVVVRSAHEISGDTGSRSPSQSRRRLALLSAQGREVGGGVETLDR